MDPDLLLEDLVRVIAHTSGHSVHDAVDGISDVLPWGNEQTGRDKDDDGGLVVEPGVVIDVKNYY